MKLTREYASYESETLQKVISMRKITASAKPTVDEINANEAALQEMSAKLIAIAEQYGEAQLFTWVYRIATNETLNWLRREKVRSALRFTSIDAEMERRIDSDPFFDGDAADRALSKAVAKLPEKQRQVFILRYYDEMPYEQMSEVLDTSVGALKASYHIAQEKVRSALGKDIFVGSD